MLRADDVFAKLFFELLRIYIGLYSYIDYFFNPRLGCKYYNVGFVLHRRSFLMCK